MSEITLLESIRQGIDEMMAADSRIFVFGEDVGRRGGVFRVTEGLVDKYGPMRVLDAPLAERRSFLLPRAGPQGRRSRHPLRRQGFAQGQHRGPRPGAVSGAQKVLS